MLNDILAALRLHDWYAFAALVLTAVMQLHRKVPWLGAKLWAKIPDGWRWLPPVAYGFAIAFVAAFFKGLPVLDALEAGVGGVLGISFPAMGFAAGLKESAVPWDGGKGGKPPFIGISGPADVSFSKRDGEEPAKIVLGEGVQVSCKSMTNRAGVLIFSCSLLLGCSNGQLPAISSGQAADAVQVAFAACEAFPKLPEKLQTEADKKACEAMKRARTICTDVIAPAPAEPPPATPAADAGPADDDTREKPADSDAGAP